MTKTYSQNVNLDDNGNVQGNIPEIKNVEEGDIVQYVLVPAKSAHWKFLGHIDYGSGVNGQGSISTDGLKLDLTMGPKPSTGELDLSIVYFQDLSGLSTPYAPPLLQVEAIVKSNDPVIKFK